MNDIGVVRSSVFNKHKAPIHHPENELRISGINELFNQSPFRDIVTVELEGVKENQLLSCHSHEMVRLLYDASGKRGSFDADTYFSEGSVEAAGLGAGSTIKLALQIWKGYLRRGFSFIRPPGHHATPLTPMGFCLMNNVALSVMAVLNESPNSRLSIVDFDLHHGNGTQDIFYRNPNILFVSSHRYPFYPGTGGVHELGDGKATGSTINLPLERSFGDESIVPLYRDIVRQVLRDFKPEMLFVSAGFDGHVRDPMAGLKVTSKAFGQLAEILIGSAEEMGGKILFVLEGGYDPVAVKESVEEVLNKMIHLKRSPIGVPSLKGEDLELVDRFRDQLMPYFPSI